MTVGRVVPSFVLLALTVLTSARASAAWLAGAAAEKVTPLPFDAAKDLEEFPEALCPRAVFSGPRVFDHQEPYTDFDHDGRFDVLDAFCDLNLNGRWDGLYGSGGVDHVLEWVHDDIWARALAISDGTATVVIESITSQGLLIEDDLKIRDRIKKDTGAAEVFVSSTHNESSPDPIGIYGAPSLDGAVGARSGVDDYYIDFLVDQAVKAGDEAVAAMEPAVMRVTEIVPADVKARLSHTFPTTETVSGESQPQGTPAATDEKARILQLVRVTDASNIETILNFAAHNQQIGHASDSVVEAGKRVNRAVSDDWPGVFAAALESRIGGHAMFMVGDNGSIEDPHLNPLPAPPCPGGQDEGCFALSDSTGSALAADVAAAIAAGMTTIAPHELKALTDPFYVPLQNQLFLAAFAAGIFAHRTLATVRPCTGEAGLLCFLTEVGLLDFGPQLQMLVNPGEAYPALIEGHPFGIEEASCPERAEPPVAAWHAHADFKLEMGLGNDMIGYEIPGPEWFADPLVYADLLCPIGAQTDPTKDYDRRNEYHKLESESVGPDAGSLVATHLAALAERRSSSVGSSIQSGRFVRADGTLTRRGADAPVGLWVLPGGTTTFAPGGVSRYYMDPYAVLGGSGPGPAH
jgi:hypothetical protein